MNDEASTAYSYARKRAREHVCGKREVWWECFIAGAQVSDQCPAIKILLGSYTRVLLLEVRLAGRGSP